MAESQRQEAIYSARRSGSSGGEVGPINRKQAEVRPEAVALFRDMVAIVDAEEFELAARRSRPAPGWPEA